MRFSSLGSGSKGNSALVEHMSTCIMVDCGFPLSTLEKRLTKLSKTPDNIDAILITHEHSDHVNGLGKIARKYHIPVWTNHGTYHGLKDKDLPEINYFSSHMDFTIGDIQVSPFPVPHDAKEPVQFVFHADEKRIGVLSDLGKVTPHIMGKLGILDALMLESNHDRAMLEVGPYPRFLKERVGGGLGHLSNEQCADLLQLLDTTKMQHFVVSHISEKNNQPSIVKRTLSKALNREEDWVQVICQKDGIGWREVI